MEGFYRPVMTQWVALSKPPYMLFFSISLFSPDIFILFIILLPIFFLLGYKLRKNKIYPLKPPHASKTMYGIW